MNTEASSEIREALAESGRLLASCAVFSVGVNLLMLTGPLFMLQVYDRVLASRSESTLVALVVITAFLFLIMGLLDHARGRVGARIGARLQAKLDSRVLRAILSRSISPAERTRPATGLRDLDTLQRFAAGSGLFAFFDAPWTPVFLGVLFAFHWMLGVLAVISGILLLVIAIANQMTTARSQKQVAETGIRSAYFIEQMRAGGETVRGLGMQEAVVDRSRALRKSLRKSMLLLSDRNGMFSVASKTLRLFLQSMMLGLGAWLALRNEISPGAMIAGSILLGRALAPIDQAVGQWPLLQAALAARKSLTTLLAETPAPSDRTALPKPKALLEAHGIIVAAPGASVPAVRNASFRIEPGQAAGIAGPSASGKSTLARALAGVWRTAAGAVRLDGAELDQYGDVLGTHVGYLPQDVVLFEGTVAQNIARFRPDANDEEIVSAARFTDAHDMILKFPGGYDFNVSAGGEALSGGQRQRIALARAFYAAPVVVVMDEPDSNLDAEGTMALSRAIEGHKKRGGAAIIVAHRHGAFAQCDVVYLMQGGRPLPATSDAEHPDGTLRKLESDDERFAHRAPTRSGAGPDGARPVEGARKSPPRVHRTGQAAARRRQLVVGAVNRVRAARRTSGDHETSRDGSTAQRPGSKLAAGSGVAASEDVQPEPPQMIAR